MPSKAAEPRGHHTVSKGYLRFFAKADDRLWEYRKPSGDAAPKLIDEVATERDFYALERADGTLDQTVEKGLSKIETVAIGALRRLVNGEPLRKTDRGDIGYFVALQFVRTASFRRMMALGISANIRGMRAFHSQNQEALDATIAGLEQKRGQPMTAEERVHFRARFDPSRFTLSIRREATLALAWRMINPIASEILAMKWTFLNADPQSFFVTSDNPVVLDWLPLPGRSPSDETVGLSAPDAFVTFPITPKLCLSCSRLPSALGSTTMPQNVVSYLNHLRAAAADRFIYADRNDSDVAELTQAFNPSGGKLSDPNLHISEAEGEAHFFAGAIGFFKNPLSHRKVGKNDAAPVIEELMIASRLLRLVKP